MAETKQAPKISIVTPSFNQADFLGQTIDSILSQNYPVLEYLIMDGGSDDGSVEIIKKFEKAITYWVSETDGGQANALNKGFQMSSGEVMGFINSDDILTPGALHEVAKQFAMEPRLQWIVGRCQVFGDAATSRHESDEIISPRVPGSLAEILTLQTRMPQPAIFWRREMWQSVGLFSEALHYCFDHDYWVRALLKGFVPIPIDTLLAGYRMHDESKTCSNWGLFMEEFRSTAEKYENCIHGKKERVKTKRYWQRRRFIHQLQHALNDDGHRIDKARNAAAALKQFPQGIATRALWGYLAKTMLTSSESRLQKSEIRHGDYER